MHWYCHITVYNFLNQILLPVLSLPNICPTNWQANEFKTKQLKKLLINQLISLGVAWKKNLTTIYGSDGAQACSKHIISFFICHMEHLCILAFESLLKWKGWTSRVTSPPSSAPMQAVGKYHWISLYFSRHTLWLGSSKNLWHFIQFCVVLKFLVWSSSRQYPAHLLSKL